MSHKTKFVSCEFGNDEDGYWCLKKALNSVVFRSTCVGLHEKTIQRICDYHYRAYQLFTELGVDEIHKDQLGVDFDSDVCKIIRDLLTGRGIRITLRWRKL